MDVRILDLDRSMIGPFDLADPVRVIPLRSWGPRLRLACTFAGFGRFEADLAAALGPTDSSGQLTFIGSGDFHHVSLALLRRLPTPFNLLVLDNHPDWMRGLPFLHCGTWLHHAIGLPLCRQVFHVGGDVDFDNRYRWLAPWPALRSGRLTVMPAIRRFHGGQWSAIPHTPVRATRDRPASPRRMRDLLIAHAADLQRFPLYISLDKDVLTRADASVNWESGHLQLSEVQMILKAFIRHADQRLAGMDIVGDWSPVEATGVFRKALAWTEHPALDVDPDTAVRLNAQTNRALVTTLRAQGVLGGRRRTPVAPAV